MAKPRPKVRFAGKTLHLPHSRAARVGIGIGLLGGGMLGFLPVLGFWMIPLGLMVLSTDIPRVRRWRRKGTVAITRWWQERRQKPDSGAAS